NFCRPAETLRAEDTPRLVGEGLRAARLDVISMPARRRAGWQGGCGGSVDHVYLHEIRLVDFVDGLRRGVSATEFQHKGGTWAYNLWYQVCCSPGLPVRLGPHNSHL